MTYSPKHLAAGGGERPLFPAPPGRSERGLVEDLPWSAGVLHRIPQGVFVGLLMFVLAGLMFVGMACTPPADDTDNDPPTVNECSEVNNRPAGLKCEDG